MADLYKSQKEVQRAPLNTGKTSFGRHGLVPVTVVMDTDNCSSH